jgi:glycosyltransferase involved in cell wall biosynthesis
MIKQVSVLMPVFNSSQYLRASIKSILKQTFKDFEFIIINDGSHDDSETIIREFNDTRIKYVKKNHIGISETLNYGLSIASHDWIARMDSDDISIPVRLQTQIDYLKDKDRSHIVSSSYVLFDKNKTIGLIRTPVNNSDIQKALALHNIICHPGVMYNRIKILELGGYFDKPIEDYDLWLRIRNNVCFYNIPFPLILTRLNPSSITRKSISNTAKHVYKTQVPYYEEIRKEFPVLKKNEFFIKGWREFFYGDKKKARHFWNHIIIKNIYNFRLIIAYIFTFFPASFLTWFKKNNVINFFEYYYYCNYRVRKEISNLIKTINN